MKTDKIYIGSKNTIHHDCLNDFITELKDQVSHYAQKPEHYLEYHNLYTIYTTLLLFASTGHRPVIDPFCYLQDIDTRNNQLLIEDKAITEKHRYRITALPDTACLQIEEYIKHLKWLIYRLNNTDNPGLCNAIDKTLCKSENKSDQLLPFLFLIKKNEKQIETISISKSVLKSELKALWPFEFNQPRHNISTFLREVIYSDLSEKHGITAHHIEAHLGHMELLKHPFGSSSLQSFNDHKVQLIPYLNKMLNQQGWSVLSARKHGGYKIKKTTNWIHKNIPLGPLNRKITRKKSREADTSTVRNILQHYETNDLYRQETIDKIRDEIIKKSSKSAEFINRRLLLFFKYLSRLANKDQKVLLPTGYIALVSESSPYAADTIESYGAAIEIKKSFLNYLADKGRELRKSNATELDHTKRKAEIIISAALFDSICDKCALENLINSEFKVICESDNYFMDINHDNAFYSRWFPAEISLGLLNGLYHNKLATGEASDSTSLDILKQVTIAINEIAKTAIKINNVLDFLVQTSRSFSLLDTPGFLLAAVSGDYPNKHLSTETLIRSLRNERLVPVINDKPSVKPSFEFLTYQSNHNIETCNIMSAKAFIRNIEADLNEANKLIASKGQNIERLKVQKLISLINKRLKNKHHYPHIATYLASWCIKLCNESTDLYRKPLKFSVIDEYTRMVSKSIIYQLCKFKYLDLDIDEYEYIYEVAIDSSKHSDKTKLKNNLTDFHNYLVKSGVTDPFDWEPLSSLVRTSKVSASVDANFISPVEYEAALNLIHSISLKNKNKSRFLLQCCAMLILGYRFGTRVSEAVYLEFDNIQHDDLFKSIVIHISNNRFKTTKSFAGRRSIPLIGCLSDIEYSVLCAVFTRSVMDADSINVFSDPNDIDEIIDYSSANRIIKSALVSVTGNPKIRFHHLRHSFANRIYMLLLNNNKHFNDYLSKSINDKLFVSSQDINLLLTGHPSLSNRSLIALSAIMGHSDISTTLANYIHLTDIQLHTWNASNNLLNRINDRKNTDYITSYCTGAKLNYVSKFRQNNMTKTSELQKTVSLFINKKGFSSSDIKTEKIPNIETLISKVKTTDRIPDLIDIDSSIILSNSALNLDNNKIASRLYLSTHCIETITEQYHLLKEQSSYCGYTENNSTQDKYFSSRFVKETKRIRDHINKELTGNNKISTCTETLNRGLRSWLSYYHPNHQVTGLIFSEADSISSYIDALALLGVNVNDLIARIPYMQTRTSWYHISDISNSSLIIRKNNNKEINIRNFIVSKTIIHSFTKQRLGKDDRIELSLYPKSNHPLKYQKSLDRLLFLLSIYLETVTSDYK